LTKSFCIDKGGTGKSQSLINAVTVIGDGVKDISSEFSKEWFYRWAEGTVIGFIRDRIELNRARGMLKTAIRYIGEEKLSLIMKKIEENPVYLPSMSPEEKVKRLMLLKKGLNLS